MAGETGKKPPDCFISGVIIVVAEHRQGWNLRGTTPGRHVLCDCDHACHGRHSANEVTRVHNQIRRCIANYTRHLCHMRGSPHAVSNVQVRDLGDAEAFKVGRQVPDRYIYVTHLQCGLQPPARSQLARQPEPAPPRAPEDNSQGVRARSRPPYTYHSNAHAHLYPARTQGTANSQGHFGLLAATKSGPVFSHRARMAWM